jgi:hypothetical protein
VKLVFVLFDSLNRLALGPYGGTRLKTPNFRRLAERAVTFDGHHVGSLPCMPARRDMQTGRLSFLHRSWGPLEPFDAFPELLYQAGTYSHLITDHYHYWEDGGATYHSRYDSYEFIRGQERDPWKAMVQPHWERLRELYHERQYSEERRSLYYHHIVNREFIREEQDFPSVQCFAAGFEFLDRNRDADGWLLQIETFDPHEPFYAPARFREQFPTAWTGPIRDWPRYGRVDELPEECEALRANYYAVVALCDHLLGQLLDYFDRHDLWRDTALVLTTDHGFLLGEREAALFGYFGGAVNLVDGRYTYFRYPPDLASQEVYQYTVMPTHLKTFFTAEELAAAELARPFSFTKGAPLLKVPVIDRSPMYHNYGPGSLLQNQTVLFDLRADPGQERPLQDPAVEARMTSLMRDLMAANDAPPEAFARIGLEPAPEVVAG